MPYRDSEFDLTITLKGYGTYVFRIVDPIVFYTNISGNVHEKYNKSDIAAQMQAELRDALLPALGCMARSGVKYDEIASNAPNLTELLKEKMRVQWRVRRGIEIVSISMSNIIPDEESIDKIRELQESRIYSKNKAMLGARVGAAQANAMEAAAENTSGAVNGYMGMGMAQMSGGVNVSELMRDSGTTQAQTEQETQEARQEMLNRLTQQILNRLTQQVKKEEQVQQTQPEKSKAEVWVCECGMNNTMRFCPQCGKEKPKPAKKQCNKCNFIFPDELFGMKFCPNCGNDMSKTVEKNC